MRSLVGFVLLAAGGPLFAQAPAKFPEAKHGNGELKYVNGLAVLTVRGTPAEIGEQFGVLAVKNAPDLDGLRKRFLADIKLTDQYPGMVLMAKRLAANLPADHRAELDAAVKASGQPETVPFGNMMADLSSGLGCSTLILEKDRSATGAPLFGRNFDWVPTKGLTEHTLLVVYKPTGKRAFAAVTFSPILGVISGMNDAGLAVTINEIHLRQTALKGGINWAGTPLLSLYRRVLEECGTVAEAEKLVAAAKRTTSACMTICDATGGAVFEFTPTMFKARTASAGVCCCTNHFCIDGMAAKGEGEHCWRLPKLDAVRSSEGKLAVDDVFARLDTVSQGKATLQAMVFEPAARKWHLKVSDGPATKAATKTFEMDALLGK